MNFLSHGSLTVAFAAVPLSVVKRKKKRQYVHINRERETEKDRRTDEWS